MRCEELKELRGAYLDGELAAPARDSVEAHVAGCSECERQLSELGNVDLSIRNAAAPRLTDAERLHIMGALRRPALPWGRLAAAALIAAALPLGISAWFARERDPSGIDVITPAIDTSL